MEVLEITIWNHLETGWPVVVEHTRPGELPRRSEGTLDLNDAFEEELRALTLQPQEYGQYLGKALFQGEVRDAFRTAAGNRDTPLRVLLVVEDPLLKPLRWERLCAPLRPGGKWDFLILNQPTPFSQYLPSLTDRRFPAIGRRDLRALVLLADPPADNRPKLASFDAKATAASIRSALGEIPHDILGAENDSVGPATLDELCARITSQHYTLLHFVAHGGYRQPDGETILYLLNREGQLAPVTTTQLIEQLDRLGGRRGLPHICFLATCESAKPEAEGVLGGLAQRLVRELGIPAVVAMTEKVSIETAEALASAFYRNLRESGLVDQALVESVVALQQRPDVIVPALFSRLGGRALFSDQLDERSLTDAEIQYGLERFEGLLPERAPTLQAEVTKHAQTIRETPGADPEALSEESRMARNDALDTLNGLSEEVLDLTFPAVALDQPIPSYDARCPFPGLKAFQIDEKEFFFGREKKVEELTGRLLEERFLAVLGSSGSGKSSLVLAGMIPTLEEMTKESGKTLSVRYLTPGANPEAALAQKLNSTLPAEQPFLLVVDQFEELFTLCLDPSKRKDFLEALLGTWHNHTNFHLVLTLRADFLGGCAPYPHFKDLMQAHLELLAPMTTPELRNAMEQQAAHVSLRFEADLSHTILAEVEGEPGAMPLLQHLLLELWKRRHGRWLKASGYRALGGIKQAIAHTADAIYTELRDDQGDPPAQQLLRNIFVRLTRLEDKTKRAEETTEDQEQYRDTRQRVAFEDLMPVNAEATVTDRVRALVQRLADERLVVTTIDEKSGVTEVEVSHEALIRFWPRLRNWLNNDRESWMLLAAVRQQAKDWWQNGEKDGDLPRWGERLQQADALFKHQGYAQSKLDHEFLVAAKELAEREHSEIEAREQREREALEKAKEEAVNAQKAAEREALAQRGKARASWIGLGVAVVLLLGTGYFGLRAYWSEQDAVTAKNEAIEETRRAEKEKIRAEEKEREVGQQLARLHWTNAIDERNHDPLKAAHYFALASEAFSAIEKPKAAANADLSRKFTYASLLLEAVVRHGDKVLGAQFSADETCILTWSDDGSARLWDSHSGEAKTPPLQHQGSVWGARFSDDESRILTWSRDGSARVWDSASGEALTPPLQHNGAVNGTEFSADETRILTWSWDGSARVWDSASGEALSPPLQHEKLVLGARFNADETRILTWSDDGSAQVWDSHSGKALTPPLQHEKSVQSARFSADETRILTWSWSSARVWDSTTGKALTPSLQHKGTVRGAQFSADETRILTWSADGSVRMWDSASGEALMQPLWHKRPVLGARFNADETRILTWSEALLSGSSSARLWDSHSGEAMTPPLQHQGSVWGARFSDDESRILTWSADLLSGSGGTRLWDSRSGKSLIPPLQHSGSVWSAEFSTDETRILTRSDDGSARVWDSASGEALTPPLQHNGAVNGAEFSADETRILTWSDDGSARVWGCRSSEALAMLKFKGPIQGVRYSTDETRILIWSGDGSAQVWDSRSGKALTPQMWHKESVLGARFNDDETRILTWSGDLVIFNGSAQVWDSRSGVALTPPLQHKRAVRGAQFSADETRILTWSDDGSARVWDSRNGKALTPSLQHYRSVQGAQFNADETSILTWSRDGYARVWDSSRGELLSPPLKHNGSVLGALFSTDELHILTWSNDGYVRVWDSRIGEVLTPPLYHEKLVLGALFSADETRILTWSVDGSARVWDRLSGELVIPPLQHKAPVQGARFSTDETRILTWSTDDSARVWDSRSGEMMTLPLQHKGPVQGAMLSTDESRILTWSDDGSARVWDSASGEALTPPLQHNGAVRSAVFSSDETRIFTWSADGSVRMWDISIDAKWPGDRKVMKTQVETGTILTPAGELEALSPTAWQEKKWCQYDSIQYSLNPKRITEDQWRTSQRLCYDVKGEVKNGTNQKP